MTTIKIDKIDPKFFTKKPEACVSLNIDGTYDADVYINGVYMFHGDSFTTKEAAINFCLEKYVAKEDIEIL